MKDKKTRESTSKTLSDNSGLYNLYNDFIRSYLPGEEDDLDTLYENLRDLQFVNEPSFVIDRLCRPNWAEVELEAKK